MQELTIDEEFYFQWHLTERCNRACRHCYQDGSPTSELGLNDLLTIVDLMEGAVNKWETKGTLSLTGGEPFLRKDDLHALMDRIDRSDALALSDSSCWYGLEQDYQTPFLCHPGRELVTTVNDVPESPPHSSAPILDA
jgi:hypothetical protein